MSGDGNGAGNCCLFFVTGAVVFTVIIVISMFILGMILVNDYGSSIEDLSDYSALDIPGSWCPADDYGTRKCVTFDSKGKCTINSPMLFNELKTISDANNTPLTEVDWELTGEGSNDLGIIMNYRHDEGKDIHVYLKVHKHSSKNGDEICLMYLYGPDPDSGQIRHFRKFEKTP